MNSQKGMDQSCRAEVESEGSIRPDEIQTCESKSLYRPERRKHEQAFFRTSLGMPETCREEV